MRYELIILRQGSASSRKKGKKEKRLLPLLMKLILTQVGGSGLDAKRSETDALNSILKLGSVGIEL